LDLRELRELKVLQELDLREHKVFRVVRELKALKVLQELDLREHKVFRV
jgi:predicted RNA-binding protein